VHRQLGDAAAGQLLKLRGEWRVSGPAMPLGSAPPPPSTEKAGRLAFAALSSSGEFRVYVGAQAVECLLGSLNNRVGRHRFLGRGAALHWKEACVMRRPMRCCALELAVRAPQCA